MEDVLGIDSAGKTIDMRGVHFMSEDRIINLEIKFAHQDDFLNQLNQIVIEQQMRIERLEKQVLDLKRDVNASGGVDGSRSLKDDKPPHY